MVVFRQTGGSKSPKPLDMRTGSLLLDSERIAMNIRGGEAATYGYWTGNLAQTARHQEPELSGEEEERQRSDRGQKTEEQR